MPIQGIEIPSQQASTTSSPIIDPVICGSLCGYQLWGGFNGPTELR